MTIYFSVQPVISAVMSEERRFRVFENRMLTKIFGPKREEMTRERSGLHNEELYDFVTLHQILFG
jgi:hypothetical protein